MNIDHENFDIRNLPVYMVTAVMHRLLARAYARAARMTTPERHRLNAALLDAADAAEGYAGHCEAVVKLAETEGPEIAAAHDFELGSSYYEYAECQIREATEIFSDEFAHADPELTLSPLDGGSQLRSAL